jgi:hypothetical protein
MKTIYVNAEGQERTSLPTSAKIDGRIVTGPKAAEGWTPKRVVEGTEQKQEPRAAYPAELAIRQLALKYVPAEKLDRNPATVIAAIDAASTKGTQEEQVAVLRDALELCAGELGSRVAHLTEQARSGSLNFKDMTDGTFSVTNLGSFGIDAFTPIINLPQVAILGIGRVRGEVMTASLTIDHRAIDGVPGATFLAEVGRELASPALLLATPAMT